MKIPKSKRAVLDTRKAPAQAAKKVLAIDFDGVIHDYKNPLPNRRMGQPLPGAKESLKRYREAGYAVIVHSVRGGQPEHIAEFMDYYGLTYDTITNIKPNADYYIDDKAIRFSNWDDVNTIIYG